MTEAAFWSFVRSALRKQSMRWKPIQAIKKDNRRAYSGENKRQKWEYQCANCLSWFADKEIEVDHIVECGTLNAQSAGVFIERLFCEKEGLQLLCTACHKTKTHG